MLKKTPSGIAIADEALLTKIYMIRDQKVMLDHDLAELYGAENKYLKRQVKRNLSRFPPDFMFELSKAEFQELRSHFGTSSWGGTRYPPMAFTESGVYLEITFLSVISVDFNNSVI